MDETPPEPGPRPAAAGAPEALPQAQAAAAALLAMSRAARSTTLYDAHNAMVLHHLADYQARFEAALRDHGTMTVAVSPFHLSVAGHVVYQERDREKSMAFRLHRDGVRRLRILAHATWDELLLLLQVVAVRCAAVRDQEEDTVTLLRRADFKGIQVESVDGFTPAEELPDPGGGAKVERAEPARPPAGWDTPLRKLPAPGPLSYAAVPAEALAAYREEREADAGGRLAISLAEDLLAEATRGGWPMPNRDLVAFFSELRDALLVDRKLASMRELVDVMARAGASDLRDLMLRSLGDGRTLDLVLDGLPEDSDKLPPEYVSFLPLLGAGAALDRLREPLPEGRRTLLVKLVLARLPREAELLLARLPGLEPALVRLLAEGLVARAPERAAELVRLLLTSHDEALRLEGLAAAALAAPGTVPVRSLCGLLDDGAEPVRIRAAELLGTQGDGTAAEPLRSRLESARRLSLPEAEALGRALARVAPVRSAEAFRAWMEPRGGFLRRVGAEARAREWAAIAGMGVLPGEEAESALRAHASRSDGEVRRHCFATLARRRREGERRG